MIAANFRNDRGASSNFLHVPAVARSVDCEMGTMDAQKQAISQATC